MQVGGLRKRKWEPELAPKYRLRYSQWTRLGGDREGVKEWPN